MNIISFESLRMDLMAGKLLDLLADQLWQISVDMVILQPGALQSYIAKLHLQSSLAIIA